MNQWNSNTVKEFFTPSFYIQLQSKGLLIFYLNIVQQLYSKSLFDFSLQVPASKYDLRTFIQQPVLLCAFVSKQYVRTLCDQIGKCLSVILFQDQHKLFLELIFTKHFNMQFSNYGRSKFQSAYKMFYECSDQKLSQPKALISTASFRATDDQSYSYIIVLKPVETITYSQQSSDGPQLENYSLKILCP